MNHYARRLLQCGIGGHPHRPAGDGLYRRLGHGDHLIDMKDQPAHGVVSSGNLAPDVDLVDRRGANLNAVSHIEVPDVAYYPHHTIALLGVHDLIEDDLAGGGAFHHHSVPGHGNGNHIPCGIDVQRLIGCPGSLVAAFRPGYTLHQIESL